ncbi:MAG: hypothetical protein HY763_07285 [Planctomycetes bacterium]|nr:hypothetical protein [Planctomycetota bacterium]
MPSAQHHHSDGEVGDVLARLWQNVNGTCTSGFRFDAVEPAAIPPPAQELLVHQEHMTARLSAYYGAPAELRVLSDRTDGNWYGRRITLAAGTPPRIIELGLARVRLDPLPEPARREVLDRTRPLGDVLTRHKVLTRVMPQWYVRFAADCGITAAWGLAPMGELFGRVGMIDCAGQPAIELLEIVTGAPRGTAKGLEASARTGS